MHPGRANALDQFRAALIARGIVPPDPIIADGGLHRCHAEGRHGRGDAAYVLHLDGLPAGGFTNWRDGRGWETWRFDGGAPLSPGDRDALRARMQAGRAQCQAEAARRHHIARQRASRYWHRASAAPRDHPYLVRKGVQACGLRVYRGALVVPVQDADGVMHSLQFIGASGAKRFLKGGRVQGLRYWIGGSTGDTVCIAEGFATGASVWEATGHAVAVAFHAGNLEPVARAIREAYPNARIVVCADDDYATAGNPGMTQARQAARAVGGCLAIPAFGSARAGDGSDFLDLNHSSLFTAQTAVGEAADPPASPTLTDFNDLHRHAGLLAVLTAVRAAHPSGAERASAAGEGPAVNDWPDPEPLTEALTPLPYPVDALPAVLRDAVLEAQSFVQAPVALVACSALAALSLAGQGLVNVRRDHQLVGPVSLYVLAVAESGERKTTCDTIFGAALRDWERDRRTAVGPDVAAQEAAVEAFEAKKAGILEAIKHKRRRAQDTAEEEEALDALAREAPVAVPVPRLLYADATPEALAHGLGTGWPTGGVLSAEAGAVFGAHGMGYETILRNLALLNVLWDGGEIAVDRRSKPSFLLRDRRLTFGLMVQPDALRGFLERAGALPRGTGFIARFLIAWPASTQGTRAYRSTPASTPAVDRFTGRITALLDMPLPTDAAGGLNTVTLDLSPPARIAWIRAHDEIESGLGVGGDYQSVRDVAAKAAENVARLAALFHVLAHGPTGSVGVDAIEGAVRIVGWHLHEARRLLADLDTPPALAAAIRLDTWLLNEVRGTGSGRVPTTRVYQFGPACVRDSRDLKAALATLNERGRARMEEVGRRRYVVVNPALVEGGSVKSRE
jgi:putative DNA primase/helicase